MTVSVTCASVAPTLTGISLSAGPSGGTVTLTGTGFYGASVVNFGSTPAAAFTVVSDTQITATVPAGLPVNTPQTVTVTIDGPGAVDPYNGNVYGSAATAQTSTAASVTYTFTGPASFIFPVSLPGGTVGSAYSQSAATTSADPFTPYTYSVTSGALPAGLSLDASTGLLLGTPTASGSFDFTITVADTGGNTGSRNYALTIARAAVTASITASGKTYDGTTAATVTGCTLTGVLAADAGSVTCSAGNATFASSGVGTGITVTATGITLGGSAADNYTLSSTSATTQADITAASATAQISFGSAAITLGQSANLIATLSGAVDPTGTVTFTEDGVTLCSAQVSSAGVASCTASGLLAGSHAIGASYTGDTDNAVAPFGAQTLMVNPASLSLPGSAGTPTQVSITGPVGCTLDAGTLQLAAATAANDLPAGATAPLGVLSFAVANGCTSVTVTIAYPSGSLAGLAPLKYGPHGTPAQTGWFKPDGLTVTGDTVSYTIADGGDGDSDPNADSITDPFAPLDLPLPASLAGPVPVPLDARWMLMLLGALLAGVGAVRGGRGMRQ